MTAHPIHLSPDLRLPVDVVTQTIAILAKKRRGKTYTASVLAEELVKAGLPFVAIDPTGAWWGLRASADGKRPGLPVVVIGGDHGDLPLDVTQGAAVADLVVEHPGWYVLDLSLSGSNAEQDRFAADFAERLYRRKASASARAPLHLFVDEADAFVPQQPMPDQRRMLGAFDTIVRRGGIRGIGVTLISQRPAVVSKNVLSQCELLLALQIVGEADRDAIDGWVKGHGTRQQRDELLASLASLDLGEAWAWSPSWLGIFKRVQVRRRETFNSSKTPEAGETRIEPKALAPVDIEKIRGQFAAAAQKAEAEDPKKLRARIAALERDLAAAVKTSPAPAKSVTVEVPTVSPEARAELNGAVDAARELLAGLQIEVDRLEKAARAVVEGLARASAPRPAAAAHIGRAPVPRAPAVPRAAGAKVEGVTAPQQRILDALAWLESVGIVQAPKTQVALLSGASPTSGTFANNLGALRSAGLIDYPAPGTGALTHEGRAVATRPEAPPTTADLHRAVLGKVSGPQARILTALIAAYPGDQAKDDLAERAGASATSGTYANNLGALRSLGFIDYPAPGRARAEPVLFLEERRG